MAYSYSMLYSYFTGGVLYEDMYEKAISPFFISPTWDADKSLSLITHEIIQAKILPGQFLIIDGDRCWVFTPEAYRERIKMNTSLYPTREDS